MNTEKKYVLDECIKTKLNELPKNVINLRTLALLSGCKTPRSLKFVHFWSDQKILDLASKRGLIVITCDSGFILRAILQKKNIIYQDREHNYHLIKGTSTETIDMPLNIEITGGHKL